MLMLKQRRMERQERQRQQRQKDKDREIEQEMERKFITADDLDSAEEESERTGKSIFDILKRRKGYVIITQGQQRMVLADLLRKSLDIYGKMCYK
jgi:hypothetical protein